MKARIEGAPGRLPRAFVGVLGSREEDISEAAAWALGWLRRLDTARPEIEEGKRGRAVR